MRHSLVIISFVLGLIPALWLLVLYGFRTAWTTTVAGRAVFYLVSVIATSYTLSLLVLLFPEFFKGSPGDWIRIVSRLIIAVALWNLLFLFFRAQRAGEISPDEKAKEALDGLETARQYIVEPGELEPPAGAVKPSKPPISESGVSPSADGKRKV